MSKSIMIKDIDLGPNAASNRGSLEKRVGDLEKAVKRLERSLKKSTVIVEEDGDGK